MSNELLLALEITALGMGLVFGAIILLWWMMALLTSIMAEKEPSPALSASVPDPAENTPATPTPDLAAGGRLEKKARAAAIAVAMALAEQQISPAYALSTPPTAIVSAWQLGMRTRHLSEKGTPILRKPRKVG